MKYLLLILILLGSGCESRPAENPWTETAKHNPKALIKDILDNEHLTDLGMITLEFNHVICNEHRYTNAICPDMKTQDEIRVLVNEVRAEESATWIQLHVKED